MVKIAIAAASSQLARELIDKLVETQKHEIIALVRQDPAGFPSLQGVKWIQTSYQDKSELVQLLKGIHTVFCFFPVHLDPDSAAQKRLIDASVEAGVKRYAPSEWATGTVLESSLDAISWYAGKVVIREYLKTLNKDKKVLEYCLFQPGGFMDVLAHPHQTTKYLKTIPFLLDFDSLHAIAIDGQLDSSITFTSVEDICNVVLQAVDFEGEWPIIGGIRGSKRTIADIIGLGNAVRGKPFKVELLQEDDLKAGIIKTENYPRLDLPSVPQDQVEAFSKMAAIGILLSIVRGAWTVTDEWNQLLPDYKFLQIEDFLTSVWKA